MRRNGVRVAVLLLTCYLVLVGGSWFGLYLSSLRTTSVVLAAMTLAVWGIVAWRSPEWRPRSALLPAIGVALASLAASTVVSRFPRQSVEYLAYAVILAALYLLLVRILADPFLRGRMGSAAVVLCAALSLAFVWLTVSHWLGMWALVGRVTVPPLRPAFESLNFGNPAAVMTITVLLLASAIGTIGLGSRLGVAGLGVLTCLVLFVTITSGSRAGWLAVAVAVVVTPALAMLIPDARRQIRATARSLLQSTSTRLVLAGLAIIGLVGVATLGPGILERFGAGGESMRTAYLSAALRMFAEAPILGTGPGTWVIQRVRYTESSETDFYIPHAHNIYLQTLSELGVAGALAGVVAVVGLGMLLRGAIKDPDPTRRTWGWVATFVLIYFGVHQLFDFYANMPAILFAAALPVAWLDATRRDDRSGVRRPGPRRIRVGAIGAVGAIAVACGGLLLSESAAMTHETAVAAYEAGDWARADDLAQQADVADPAWPPYQLTEGLTAAAVGDHARAAARLRRAAEADDLPEAWLDLAAEERLVGREAAARDALGRSARLGLQRPALAMAIGDLALRLGDDQLTPTAFAAALARIPSLAGDPWWHAEPDRAALFPAILDAGIARAGTGTRWQIALAAGDIDRARSLAGISHVGGSVTAADVIDAWDGDPTAMERVIAGCEQFPTIAAVIDWCARLSARDGNTAEADRYRAWSFPLLGESTGPFEVRVSEAPVLGSAIQGDVAAFYGTYTYRRTTPWNLLVPSLVQLKLT
jgi:O-antigen ligase/tetratricopeptide (TPR) repeat protein